MNVVLQSDLFLCSLEIEDGNSYLAPDSFRILKASLDDFGWPHQASPIGNGIGLSQNVGVASPRAHVCHQSRIVRVGE